MTPAAWARAGAAGPAAGAAGAAGGAAGPAGEQAGPGSRACIASSGLAARVRLAALPTPLVAAPRLARVLGTGPLLIKRDDLTGFAFGGNKARVLEFLVAGAIADGAGTLVAGGAPGSNFCAAAAAAAQRAGLGCQLVIAGHPAPPPPALALALSWGAVVRWTRSPERESVDGGLPAAAADLASRGQRPYLIPRGGATALGAMGYLLAAFELRQQLAEHGSGPARVVVAVGSGGTLAGLVAGNVLLGRPWTLFGASVSRPPDVAAARVLTLAGECLRMLGSAGPEFAAAAGLPRCGAAADLSAADVTVDDARGAGHGLPSPEASALAEQAMRTEGLMVDPVYTAKALATVRRCAPGDNVVFWHTGGVLDVVAAATGDRR